VPPGSISQELVALISQTELAVVAAGRVRLPSTTSPASQSSSTPTVGAIGGLPLPGISPLSTTLQASFLVQSFSGRPISPVVVPFFVSTFSAPVMSVALFASGTASSIFGDSRDVTVANIVQPLALVNQPFVMGLGFSPVPTKLITQILVGKYIVLSELLPANLQYKEPRLQLLFYG